MGTFQGLKYDDATIGAEVCAVRVTVLMLVFVLVLVLVEVGPRRTRLEVRVDMFLRSMLLTKQWMAHRTGSACAWSYL